MIESSRRSSVGEMTSTDYRALSVRTVKAHSKVLHLIREDSEATLCGMPRGALGPCESFDQFVCDDCIEWLAKRKAVSATFRAVKRP